MTCLRLIHLTSIAQLRSAAPAWDDLWRRSEVTAPTARAELVAQWVERFAARAEFHVLAVEADGLWVAALPLVHRRLGHLIDVGTLPSNQWSSGGELLTDTTADLARAADLLVGAFKELPWQIICFGDVAIHAPRWLMLRKAADRIDIAHHHRPHYEVGRIEVHHDWQAFRRQWSAKHRQNLARASRRLAAVSGSVQFLSHTQFQSNDIEPMLRQCFAVEDRSWKGQAGTSVMRTPDMFPFFLRQARQLADWGHLELSSLQADGQMAAFAYGMAAKGVYHSVKIGYDPRFAAYSPGQLLRWRMLEDFHCRSGLTAVDCSGPLTEAHCHWRPQRYLVGPIALAPGRFLGRMAVQLYRRWRQ